MVSPLGLLALVTMVAVNTAIAAVLTRLLRVRLDTVWGTAVYVAFLVPVVLGVTTLLMGSVAGPDLGSRAVVGGLLVALPMVLGVSIDVLWMPSPGAVDLPDATD